MQSGAEQLKDWMERRGVNLAGAAELLGWDETFVSKLLRGRRLPGRMNAIHLEDVTGISIRAWESSPLDKSGEAVPVNGRKRR